MKRILPFLLLAAPSLAGAAPILPHNDISYAQMPGVEPKLLSFDLFTATHLTNAPVFVYIHGGAWVGATRGAA